ncbi:MAG: acyl-phosphate glycerol 3-phosphate acyltransferase [Bacteroidetes bacterium HGW-Bacteroidetes-1]|jgi:glycerol-3-phosphate acyltransferase PlsY|nr:MAG: acyl-phosphate glycerol 3-phosphate acyltransferase [Bacteroidetes bacterium HGW-Bacteroidetes-1]
MAILLSLLFAYLLGSIPTAVWVGKWFYDVDVRNAGSGNAGATNTIRVLGVKAGIPVIIIDVLKGYIAVISVTFIVRISGGDTVSPYLEMGAGAMAVIGHTLPVFAGFRGGKGVATLLGVGLGLFPYAAWVAVAIFVIVLIFSKYVSLSSMSAGILFPFVVYFVFPPPNWAFYVLAVAVAVFIPYTHRKNIKRLFNGTESKVNFSNWKKHK